MIWRFIRDYISLMRGPCKHEWIHTGFGTKECGKCGEKSWLVSKQFGGLMWSDQTRDLQ